MSLDKPSVGVTSFECAAKVMETIPLLMRFIRADMRTHSADSLSIPQLRSAAMQSAFAQRPGTGLAIASFSQA